jgi:hypothetical protein
MITYRVSTFDVWGNNRDGFEVNDAWNAGTIEVQDNATDEEIFKAVKELLGFTARLSSVDMQWEDENHCFAVYTTTKTRGKPFFSLTNEEFYR